MPMQEQRCLFGTYLCIEDGDTAEGELEADPLLEQRHDAPQL